VTVNERLAAWRRSVNVALVGVNSHEKKRRIEATTRWLRARLEHASTLAEQMRVEREASERLTRAQWRSLEKLR
jgi:hypothetical protein